MAPPPPGSATRKKTYGSKPMRGDSKAKFKVYQDFDEAAGKATVSATVVKGGDGTKRGSSSVKGKENMKEGVEKRYGTRSFTAKPGTPTPAKTSPTIPDSTLRSYPPPPTSSSDFGTTTNSEDEDSDGLHEPILPFSPSPGEFADFSGVHFNGIEPGSIPTRASSHARSSMIPQIIVPARKSDDYLSPGKKKEVPKKRAVLGDKTSRSQLSAKVVTNGDFDEIVVPKKGVDKENTSAALKGKRKRSAATGVREEEEEEETEAPKAKKPKSPTTTTTSTLRRSTRVSINTSTTTTTTTRKGIVKSSSTQTPTKIKQTDVTNLLKRKADKVTDDELTLPDGSYSVSYDDEGNDRARTKVVKFEVVIEKKNEVVEDEEEGMEELDLPSIEPVTESTPKVLKGRRKDGSLAGKTEVKKEPVKKKGPENKKGPEKKPPRARKTRASILEAKSAVNDDEDDEDQEEEEVSKSGKDKLKKRTGSANKDNTEESAELQPKKKAVVKKAAAKKASPKKPAAKKKKGDEEHSYNSGLMDLIASDWE